MHTIVCRTLIFSYLGHFLPLSLFFIFPLNSPEEQRVVFIVMGVSGSGKTTIGKALARALNIPFHDADSYHSKTNVEKMKRGIPLTDNDRSPWLETLSSNIEKWEKEGGGVLACSALKAVYRKILVSKTQEQVTFIFLQGTRDRISERMRNRKGHFMPETLLDSQFSVLEPPKDAITVSVENTPEKILEEILLKLHYK